MLSPFFKPHTRAQPFKPSLATSGCQRCHFDSAKKKKKKMPFRFQALVPKKKKKKKKKTKKRKKKKEMDASLTTLPTAFFFFIFRLFFRFPCSNLLVMSASFFERPLNTSAKERKKENERKRGDVVLSNKSIEQWA
jgi:hypothetical protein